MKDKAPKEIALLEFKSEEAKRSENLHPLVKDPVLRDLVTAWSMFHVEFGDPEGEPPEDEKARWKWLWSNVEYDSEEFAEILRLDGLKVGRLVSRAASFRLIYPDGSSSTLALQFIRSEIQKAVSKKPGRPPKDRGDGGTKEK
jgi:hypothetical protein